MRYMKSSPGLNWLAGVEGSLPNGSPGQMTVRMVRIEEPRRDGKSGGVYHDLICALRVAPHPIYDGYQFRRQSFALAVFVAVCSVCAACSKAG